MKELLLLSGLGIFALLAEILNFRKFILPVVIAGLILNIGFCINDFGNNESVFAMLKLDSSALSFTILFSFVAILWFLFAKDYFTDKSSLSDHIALVSFSMVGVFILTSYTHLVMLFLGVEILSIPVYVLAGSDKRNIYSNEAAFKYFLLGAFASGFLLLGITFLYGATGSFNILQLAAYSKLPSGLSEQLLMVGFALVLFAFAFKMSAVPFHFRAPDVYSGAPTVITAYMSTIVKIGAIAGFYRLFLTVISQYSEHYFKNDFYTKYLSILLLIAILTITVGNIIAAAQTNVKRLLAYSSIGHAGFILLGITMLTMSTTTFTWYYLFAYSLASLASFWVLMIVSKESNSEDVSAFNGLVKRNPILAVTMTIALLSMAGIPPMAGFFAKYFILMNVIGKGYILIAVMAILVSLIGVYYYFKIIIAMFTGVADNQDTITVSTFNKIMLLFISLLIIVAGIAPDFVFQFILR